MRDAGLSVERVTRIGRGHRRSAVVEEGRAVRRETAEEQGGLVGAGP